MKKLLFLTLLISSIQFNTDWFDYFKADYFFSSNGAGGNSGLTPWNALPIDSINSVTFSPGDRVGIEGEWNGTITVGQSGTAGNPITYKSYGNGATITGFTTVTAWTNTGGNIWESTNAVSTLDYLNIVTIEGKNTPMGTTPNRGDIYACTVPSWTISSVTDYGGTVPGTVLITTTTTNVLETGQWVLFKNVTSSRYLGTKYQITVINATQFYFTDTYYSGILTGTVYSQNHIKYAGLTGTPDYTGAQIAMRKTIYSWQVSNVTDQRGDTLIYTDLLQNYYDADDGEGFFIQQHTSTLDVQNEWYYNPSTKKLQIYSTSEPVDVKVPTIDKIFSITNKQYITLKNINFTGGNYGVNINTTTSDTSRYISILNCEFENIGLDGVNFQKTVDVSIDNCNFKNINYCAINNWISIKSRNTTITNNVIDSVYWIVGGTTMTWISAGILINADPCLVQYNKISNTGKESIKFSGTNINIVNNLLINSGLTLCDGGAIYTYNSAGRAGKECNIDGNIIINPIGSYLGVPGYANDSTGYMQGIYLDSESKYVNVTNNTINGGNYSLYASNGNNHNKWIGNTAFNPAKACFRMNNIMVPPAKEDSIYANVFKRNKLIVGKVNTGEETVFPNVSDDPLCMYLISNWDDVQGFFTEIDSNYYSRPQLEDTLSIRIISTGGYSNFMSLSTLKSYIGQDANSKISPDQLVSSDNDMKFYYNENKTVKIITLEAGMWIDVEGNIYSDTVSLQPFTSLVVWKHSFSEQFEASRYFVSLVTPLADSSKAVINEFVYHTKNVYSVDSLPQAFEAIYVMKSETKEAALKNLVKRTDFDLVDVNNTTFTQLQGIAGNGSNSYLNTTFIPSTDGTVFTQNSASMSLYSNTDGILNAGDMGSRNATSTYRTIIFIRYTGDLFYGNLNSGNGSGGTTSIPNDKGTGYFTTSRLTSTLTNNYINDKPLGGNILDTAYGLSAYEINICRINTANTIFTYSNRQFSYADISRGKTANEVQTYYMFVQWLLDNL